MTAATGIEASTAIDSGASYIESHTVIQWWSLENMSIEILCGRNSQHLCGSCSGHANALTWREDDCFLSNAKRFLPSKFSGQKDESSIREMVMSTLALTFTMSSQ